MITTSGPIQVLDRLWSWYSEYSKCVFFEAGLQVYLAVRETIFCPGPPPQKKTAWPGINYTARRGRAATWVYPRMRAADPFRWGQGTHYPGEGVVSHSSESSSLIATIVSHHLPVNLWPSLRLPSAIWLPPKKPARYTYGAHMQIHAIIIFNPTRCMPDPPPPPPLLYTIQWICIYMYMSDNCML